MFNSGHTKFFIFLILMLGVLSTFVDFSPEGQALWGYSCNNNTGQQSPIDFPKHYNYLPVEPIMRITQFNPIVTEGAIWAHHDDRLNVRFNITDNQSGLISLRLNSFNYTYNVYSLGFKWPSEHTLDGVTYGMEVQLWGLLNPDLSYPNDSSALLNQARINWATFAVVFEVDDHHTDFPTFSNFTLGEAIPIFDIKTLFNFDHGYYTYYGSDSVPFFQCLEEVVWTVMAKPLKISKDQYYSLKNLLVDSGYTYGIARLTQPLGWREIYKHSPKGWRDIHHHSHGRDIYYHSHQEPFTENYGDEHIIDLSSFIGDD